MSRQAEIVRELRVSSASQALGELETLAEGAEVVLSHNLIELDLPILRAAVPGLRLLQLPAVDTLWLNPLAFPRNPYHRLVTHYKHASLTRSERNDPYLDARLALQLFSDQCEVLQAVLPGMLAGRHWPATRGPHAAGFDLFFTALRNSRNPDESQAREAILGCLDGRAYQTQLRRAIDDAREHGGVLALTMAWISLSGGSSVLPPWVRHQCLGTSQHIRSLRDEACDDERCSWCRGRHNAVQELERWFGFDSFRPDPADPEVGQSMQQMIVEAAMAGPDALAILPTGTGKSLCHQLPALSRYCKTGGLISGSRHSR